MDFFGDFVHDPLYKYFFIFIGALIFLRFFLEIVLPDIIEIYRDKKRFSKGMKWRSNRELLQYLQGLTHKDFEKYVAELFRNLGYIASVTGGAYDGGIDIVLEKDGRKSYVQCKKYTSTKVSVSQLRDFYGALADRFNEGQGFLVTTGIFTLEAQRFAKDKPIELIDGARLLEYIHQTKKFPEESSKQKEECPQCGGLLVLRKGKYGNFMGCSNYPDCNFTKTV